MELTFTVLKYLGMVIAAASAIWALLKKLTYEDESGRRRLTGAGRGAVSLLLVGFLVSVFSGYIEHQLGSKSAQRAREEFLSQTRLRRLRIDWTFDRVPAELRKRIHPAPRGAKGPCPDKWRRSVLYPWLVSLAGGPPLEKRVILLLSLDQWAANVLPLGILDLQESDDPFNPATNYKKDRLKEVAATIEFREDFERCVNPDPGYPAMPRLVDRSRRCNMNADMKLESSNLTVSWDLNHGCISKGVDSADPSQGPSARFPDRIVLLLLTDINDLPFDPGDFTQTNRWLPWNFHEPQGKGIQIHSHLTLVANELVADKVDYDLRFHGRPLMGGKGGGGGVYHDYPVISIWTGEKRRE